MHSGPIASFLAICIWVAFGSYMFNLFHYERNLKRYETMTCVNDVIRAIRTKFWKKVLAFACGSL